MFEHRDEAVLNAFVEKLQIVPAFRERPAQKVLDKAFGQIHIVVQIEKGHFGFYHPEFGQVPRRVRIFCAERRSECVHAGKGGCKRFRFELAAHRETRFFTEKVFRIIDEG